MTDYWNKEILVLGCGNILFGDDGFGPEVADYLQKILFNIVLNDKRPKRIIIVDAVDAARPAGEIFELDISSIPEKKIDDFSMHQLPTSNLLKELKETCGVDVKVISVQVEHIPEEVCPGLSKTVREAIPAVCERIFHHLD
jgi:coenzyme F420 hydrogenase subunit delta